MRGQTCDLCGPPDNVDTDMMLKKPPVSDSLEYVRGVLQFQHDEALREVDATSRALDALDQAIEGEK